MLHKIRDPDQTYRTSAGDWKSLDGRGCLEYVPHRPMDISMARHIHNTYARRVIEERGDNTILCFSRPQVNPSEELLPRFESQPVLP